MHWPAIDSTGVNRFITANSRSNSANGIKAVILSVYQHSCSEPNRDTYATARNKRRSTKEEGTKHEEVRIRHSTCRRADRRGPWTGRTGGGPPPPARAPPRTPPTTPGPPPQTEPTTPPPRPP